MPLFKRATRRARANDYAFSLLLETIDAVTSAAAQSSESVFQALDASVRQIAPEIDSVLVFAPDGDDLQCIFAAGTRAVYFSGLRIRRDRMDLLPPAAALAGHRVSLRAGSKGLIPGDRAALAIPMSIDGCAPIVYLSGHRSSALTSEDTLAALVLHAAAPYALAVAREGDRRRSTYDALTGLLTPRAFRDQLLRDLETTNPRRNQSIGLWFVDADNFKLVNDRFGHGAGDAVLRQIAGTLRAQLVEEHDLAARNGGDEFCALVRGVEKMASIDRAQRFCTALRAHDFGLGIAITASIGVAVCPYDAVNAAGLLEAADAAMYHSKNSGRDRVSYVSASGTYVTYR